ncbi:NAC domain-containing protein 7-like [Mangifera indica]|uniref:NAC domain-containing protein 7-like n=1 Tax=Mangifera indica TaxID=29780 RepID=UPI001CFAF2E2|nr:NAC domain-containing protein 7-like [Mangifera indica]
MEAAKSLLPVGCVFDPTDSELVGYFLYNKIVNQLIPNLDYFIPEYNLYGSEEPWEIWDFFKQQFAEECRKDLFFFTQLKKRTLKESKINRTIGEGTWHGEDAGLEIIHENHRIGKKKRFRYENKQSKQHGGWIMHEYSLDLSLLGLDQHDNFVVCRIRKNELALQKNQREKSEQVKRRKVVEADPEKKNKRTKVQKVDPESLPLSILPITTCSDSSTIVQQSAELENDEYGSIISQFGYELEHGDSQQFFDIDDIFRS